jgi:hypothetical protein
MRVAPWLVVGAVLVCSVVLSGCPGAILLSAAVSEPQHGYVHPPNAKDYAAWLDTPKAEIETHSQFALMPREVRAISDGSEMWILRYCPAKARGRVTPEVCCLYEFVLRDAKVASYKTVGACAVNCSMRPETKVQACINEAIVPDGYGASAGSR